MKKMYIILLTSLIVFYSTAQVQYPYPVDSLSISVGGRNATMVYMDVHPSSAATKNVVLLHGKNFNGYYWKDVVPFFTQLGYRVIVPDQIGWGKSDKPEIPYSFHLLAHNTKSLLDSLRIKKAIILGHSMGGMLATRFTLMYPGMVDKLILENPIGLEDYKTFVRYQTLDSLFEKEKKATYASYQKYQQTYYPVWKPEYEEYVKAQATDLNSLEFPKVAWVNALTYQMIYEQPIVYELNKIKVPTLLIIGQLDRTVVGKDQLNNADKLRFGQYKLLGKRAKKQIKSSKLVELNGVGHIPHIQSPDLFYTALKGFL